MMRQPTRRDFLKTAAALPICATALGGILSSTKLKTSLNAYSFAKLLNDRLHNRGPGISLIQVLEFAAKTGFDGFDATGYYFPTYPQVPPDSTISELKERAADLGIGISGTGVRDNLTTADKTVRTSRWSIFANGWKSRRNSAHRAARLRRYPDSGQDLA